MFGQCAKCGLTVPNSLLVPVLSQTAKGTQRVRVCTQCAKVIKEEQLKYGGK